MAKWVEFHRIKYLDILVSKCPMALWIFPKPITYCFYKEPRTGDIVFEKLAEKKAGAA